VIRFYILIFIVNGTTGEGTSLTIDERKKVTEAWASVVKETNQYLMVQVGGTSIRNVKELVRELFFKLI
jgi:N-acetylneuraminate lyase